MSETEADREFYAAAEAAFIRRRGTPFLLSPKDFALLKEWRTLGVPIEAIEQGIDDAFSRREERGATARINSLAYCRDAVADLDDGPDLLGVDGGVEVLDLLDQDGVDLFGGSCHWYLGESLVVSH